MSLPKPYAGTSARVDADLMKHVLVVDAIAHQTLGPAKLTPIRDQLGVAAKDPEKNLLVVP